MEKLIEIRLTKGVMFIPESKLIGVIPSELMIEGLKAGKGIIRNRRFNKRVETKNI
jgi:hypothetical protein